MLALKFSEHLVERWTEKGLSQAVVTLVARKGVIVSHQAYGSAILDMMPALAAIEE
ncbi:hypothetical protein [Paenibacillus chungangensis]|uniref:Uncharacterized protein n=1 Tax=Paenibacillus chungangensis TaxID=696535 RepID=A0ABW3HNF8_9BACL